MKERSQRGIFCSVLIQRKVPLSFPLFTFCNISDFPATLDYRKANDEICIRVSGDMSDVCFSRLCTTKVNACSGADHVLPWLTAFFL